MMPKPFGDGPPDDRRRVLTHYRFGVGSAKCIKVCAACGCRCSSEESFCTGCGERLPEKNLYEQSVAGKKKMPRLRVAARRRQALLPNMRNAAQTKKTIY